MSEKFPPRVWIYFNSKNNMRICHAVKSKNFIPPSTSKADAGYVFLSVNEHKEEIKSLRESIADLQKALEKIFSEAGRIESSTVFNLSRPLSDALWCSAIESNRALELLKARGHYVEVKK